MFCLDEVLEGWSHGSGGFEESNDEVVGDAIGVLCVWRV